jgi:hypothetical protein
MNEELALLRTLPKSAFEVAQAQQLVEVERASEEIN